MERSRGRPAKATWGLEAKESALLIMPKMHKRSCLKNVTSLRCESVAEREREREKEREKERERKRERERER